MSFNQIQTFHTTIPLSIQYESSWNGVQVVGVSMPDGPIPVKFNEPGTLPVVRTGFESFDTKTWPDGLENMNFVDVNNSIPCPDISQIDYHIFNEDPLIVYIPTFVTRDEVSHLLQSNKDNFSPAYIYRNGASETDSSFRRSENAWPKRDNVLQCIEQRAIRLQSYDSDLLLEHITLQRYQVDGFFSYHLDQFDSPPNRYNRRSTFNVFLESNCVGGGTHFPLLPRPSDLMWCQYIDCETTEPGVIFKPIAGSAVFWMTTRNDGTSYRQTLHAGMPVKSGTKIGMNIWSWKKP